ncbi:LacI family transcriptional regulator [Variovorax sp. WS11]|uniref:Bug family tripartite tricarboxylate transporter substrate binding protein n=1 Tax=Variovorax sp. WS11 TaxID=1105204 RepID=UPI000D0E0593|nr:tripartite tricarboxylate transporter substrate binding protein [Variovorax sp. WS11]NDZ13979.1 tripartite tricarboxylate transporter substrate binding protein [Variovorax sp. WS11]PSL79305.1 LacI family transcriptional regulator [Variovorax sp. WS11]
MIQRCLALLLPLLAVPLIAHAQPYPSKPVRVIVPFAPGGPADVLARVIGQELSEALGQPFVVENKVGAAGNIGVEQIAKATPDGYTVGIVPVGNVAVNPSLFPTLPYKASELAPVAMLATVENVLVVNADVPAKSLKELLALAKQKPGTLSFASPGAGSQAHLAGELMALSAEVKLIHVPYKGIGPALNDVVGGQVTMMFGAMSAVLPHVKSGKLRALGVASIKRSATMPELPTIAEQGLPRFEAVSWYALMAPAGTPAAIVDRLNAESARSLAKPAIREKFAAQGLEPGGGKPQDLATEIQAETVRWADVIKKQNIKPD